MTTDIDNPATENRPTPTQHFSNNSRRMGNLKGVRAWNGQYWIATIPIEDREYCIGKYLSIDEAALAYDMEILRAYGNHEDFLNFSYKIIGKDEAANRMTVMDSKGTEFIVDVCPNLQSYKPMLPPESQNWDGAPIPCLPLLSDGGPPRSSLIRPWLTRVTTSYTSGVSFCYEITFPDQNPLGLSLKPKSIYYSSAGTNKYIGTLVVEEAQTLLATVVYPGDILLRINNTNLCNFGEDFDFETATNVISSSNSPRTVRFLRPLGPDHTLSPAEVACFLSLPSTSICQCRCPSLTEDKEIELTQALQTGNEDEKFDKLSDVSEPIAKFNVVVNTANSSLSLHQISCDSQAPPQVKKIMQGQKVAWETPPAASNTPLPSPFTGKVGTKSDLLYDESISKLKREVYRESTGPASVSSVAATNSYNMGGKWIAQLIVPLGPVVSNKRSILSAFEESDETPKDFKRIFLGRYDYEEEANAVLRIAKQEWSSTGIFVPRRLAPPQKPGAYLSQSSQSHGGPQSYSYNSQGPMRPSPQQYSNVPSVQGKVYYPDPKVPHHTSQSTGQRPQSMQPATSLPQTQVNTQFGYYQPYLQPRGAPQPVHASQTPTNVMPYLPAPPKSHLQYPLQRPGDPLPSSFPSQTFQPYASSGHHLHRANTSPNYPTDPSSVLPSPDGQVMYLTPTSSTPRAPPTSMYPNSSSGLPPQLPSLPRQM